MSRRNRSLLIIPAAAAGLLWAAWLVFFTARSLLFWGVPAPWGQILASAAVLALFVRVIVRPVPVSVWAILLLYLLLFSLLCEGLLGLSGLSSLRRSGIVPFLLSASVLLYAFLHEKRTVLRRYRLETPHALPGGSLRIGVVSDVHMGHSVDVPRLGRALERISAESPDLIILAGDLVDDRTLLEEMTAACRALGAARSRLGTFFIFGNHDTASHGPPLHFSRADLERALSENGVTVLEDRAVCLDGFVLAGRADAGIRSERLRKPLPELLPDSCGPVIVCDHQPAHGMESVESGAVLQISGHTHGGQMWPAGLLLRMFSKMPGNGSSLFGGTWVVTSCGLGTRGARMRCGSTAESVLIDLISRPE